MVKYGIVFRRFLHSVKNILPMNFFTVFSMDVVTTLSYDYDVVTTSIQRCSIVHVLVGLNGI